MKKICFIAQFPPPVHGLSKAVETLFNSRLSSEYEFEKVDITNSFIFTADTIGSLLITISALHGESPTTMQ